MRVSYGVSVVILKSDSLSATIIAVPYVILWQIRPCFNGTWLYLTLQHSMVNSYELMNMESLVIWM